MYCLVCIKERSIKKSLIDQGCYLIPARDSASLERREIEKASMADCISALPDDLLHHVLSFLPAHEVVRTCMLARRWRHLWKSAPALRVTGVKGCTNEWFVNFVDSLLLLRDPSRRLDSFEVDLNYYDDFDSEAVDFDRNVFVPVPANEEDVNRWFRHALLCRPRVLLALRTDYPIIRLPNVPLISRHLTRLELQSVCVRSSTLDFSRCPALLHLSMDNCYIYGNISSPFLKHLSIIYCCFRTYPFRARIYLPALVSLELDSCFGRMPVLVESMPLLTSAIVRIDTCRDCCRKNDHGGCDDRECEGCYDSGSGADDRRGESVLLKGLSQVAALELWVHPQVFIINRDLKLCPIFSNLKTLLLTKWCPRIAGDLNILSCFLKNSPILEKLTLQLFEERKIPMKTQRSYTPSKQSFAFNHLKIVEIKCDKVGGRAHKVLDILSTFNIPLEKVTIQRGN
ncbi:hypothetical protein ZWY2020_007322 [Hordeum vulgare]|nr:hypothetical protein ZWY2020_007322 [Hordeum vulgare]